MLEPSLWWYGGPLNRAALDGRGGEVGTQKVVYQKWPNQVFPGVNLVLSHDDHWGGTLNAPTNVERVREVGGGGAPATPGYLQHPCPSKTRRWFRQFLVIYHCLDKGRGRGGSLVGHGTWAGSH